jgi:hypothetical protein
MGTKYTEGKWIVKRSESKPAFNIVGTALGRKYKIARCPITDFGSKYPETNKAELTEVEANAKLIAAAPELLEACKKMIQAFNNTPQYWLITDDVMQAENIMIEAIKKATE